MGKSAHVRTSVEPHSNLKLVSLFCKARTNRKSGGQWQRGLTTLHHFLIQFFEFVPRDIVGDLLGFAIN